MKFAYKSSEIPCWCIAFLINLLVAMCAIVPFIALGQGYFAMSYDFSAQEIPFNIFINDAIKSGNILWNWSIDLGGNFLEAFSFYNIGSIFTWITLLFPSRFIPNLIGWMIILKFAVAGATSAEYINRYIKKRETAILASVLYSFSGFQCSSIVFYHFQDVVAFFPLLLIALDDLMQHKKRGRLIIACVINIFCNFVFFAGEVIFLIIYYAVKYLIPDIKNKNISKSLNAIGRCFTEGIIALLFCGVLVFPSISGLMTNSRASNHLLGESWFSISTQQILLWIKAFFLPAEIMSSTSSILKSDWTTNAAYLPLFGMTFVIAYCLKSKDWISRLIKTGIVFSIVPLFNSVFVFFNSTGYHRWYYMLILIFVIATAKVLDNPQDYDIKIALKISLFVIIFYASMLTLVKWNSNNTVLVNHSFRFAVNIILALIGLLLTWFCFYGKIYKKLYTGGVLGFSILLLAFNVFQYQWSTDNTQRDFKKSDLPYAESIANYLMKVPIHLNPNSLPYRYYFDEGIGYTYYNIGLTNSLPTINSFNSTIHSSIIEFYNMLGTPRGTMTPQGPIGTRELLSVKYIILTDEKKPQSYVLENALPVGYTYNTYMTRSEFENIEPSKRALMMLKTLVIRNEDETLVQDYLRHYNPATDGEAVETNMETMISEHLTECSNDFSVSKNKIQSIIETKSKSYAFFSIPFDKYWTAQVNDTDVDILNINGLIAIPLEKGINNIEFHYQYTPILVGIISTILGVLSLSAYLVWNKKHTKNDKEVL